LQSRVALCIEIIPLLGFKKYTTQLLQTLTYNVPVVVHTQDLTGLDYPHINCIHKKNRNCEMPRRFSVYDTRAHSIVRRIVQRVGGKRKEQRRYATHILNAFDLARQWAAMNSTRSAVMHQAHPDWVVAPFTVFSPQKLSRGKRGFVMQWIQYATTTYMQYVRHPTAGLVVPLVWQNHYSVLLIPRNPQSVVQWFDPNYMGKRTYPSLNIVDIQQALNRPVHVRTFFNHKPSRVGGAPQDDGRHDVFCAVWMLWYMTYGVRWGPAATKRPKFSDVFRFLQNLIRTLQLDFRDFLFSESVRNVNADRIIATILTVTHKTYKMAFHSSYA
jgi:hypothetical protein